MEPVMGVVEELRDLKEELRQAAEALRDSLRLQREIIDRQEIIKYVPVTPLEVKKIHPYFTYPRDGTKKTVGVGITQIDFYDGTVVLPDGTDDVVSDKLEAYGEDEYIRSFQVDTNQDIKIWLDDFGKKPIDKDDIHLEAYQQFRRLYIQTTASTQFHVWASTFAEAYIRSLKPAIFRGTINENYQIVNPLSEYGDPITKPGYYAGSDTTYQQLVKWDIPAGYYGVLHEVSFTADSLARYRFTIGGTEQFADLQLTTPITLPLPANKLTGGQSLILEVKSAGGAIEVNGAITGKNVFYS